MTRPLPLIKSAYDKAVVCCQLCGDIVKDLKAVSQHVSERPIDDSLSLWLEVGTIKPVFALYTAVADFVNLQQHLSRRLVTTESTE